MLDSYNFFNPTLAFEVLDNRLNSKWDIKKNNHIKKLQDSLQLLVLVPGNDSYSKDSKIGKIRLNNNSDFDLKGLKVLIEHYDNNSTSVNTQIYYVSDIVRKHSYREFEWRTYDCSQCYRQEFKINFYQENH